ncbi:MAG: prephenate dehydratase [Burkholderiales bacterium]|jgi:chorismate mutase/prephenate dehydratase|nr:prephenate dehydratase [Burkholderiales bacterium]
MTTPLSPEPADAIKLHRDAIDAIDDALLSLLNERAQHAREIGHIKTQQTAIWRPEREAQIVRRLLNNNKGPLSDEAIAFLCRQVMSACRALEKPLSIAYLGPAGTFSEQAVLRQFGFFCDAVAFPSLDDALKSAEKGQCHYAVLPIENSTEGAVARTHDLMVTTPLSVCGEIKLRINQNLLSKEASCDTIHRVYSHPQSLAQCARWLSLHLPNAERVSVGSNAEAAKRAAEEPQTAAIAGETAASNYELHILHANIEDMPNNTTRFWVLGNNAPAPSGTDMTSLIMSASRNQSGAIYALLEPFARNQVSLTRLESRPAHLSMWEYFFFVDVEGHRDDPPVAASLKELQKMSPFLKVLGSYPAAQV